MDQPNPMKVTLKAAINTIPLDSHKYLANLPLDHCYGKTAHGGLLMSVIIFAVQQHFGSTLQRYNHPHTFDVAAVFLRPASAGEAVVEITDVKLGAKVSTVHFSLVQNDKERLVGHASNTDLHSEKGISYLKHDNLEPPIAPFELLKLLDGSDPHWVGYAIPWHSGSFLKPISHFRYYSPVLASPKKNLTDVWIRFASVEERFTNEMLGSIADHWHRMVENYLPDSVWNSNELVANALQAISNGQSHVKGYSTSYRYPTLSMHLEIKKLLPPQGVQWLFLRARSTEIKNGRFDAEITILDEKLELVALSHQICFVIESAQIADEKNGRDSKL